MSKMHFCSFRITSRRGGSENCKKFPKTAPSAGCFRLRFSIEPSPHFRTVYGPPSQSLQPLSKFFYLFSWRFRRPFFTFAKKTVENLFRKFFKKTPEIDFYCIFGLLFSKFRTSALKRCHRRHTGRFRVQVPIRTF